MGASKWPSLKQHGSRLIKKIGGLVGTFENTDIIGLVSFDWEESFARVTYNQKVIAEHGRYA
jgi:hypothetical protein